MPYINTYVKEIALTRTLEILKELSNQNLTQLIDLLSKYYFLLNINKNEQSIITIHENKLQHLTKDQINPFTHEEVVKNISVKTCHLKNKIFQNLV